MRETNLKKLRLARETIATLQSVDLGDVHGGVVNTGCMSGCGQCPGDLTRPTGRPQLETLLECPKPNPGTAPWSGNCTVR